VSETERQLDIYFDTLRRVDPPAASTYVLELLDEGTPLRAIAEDVLRPAQVRVGQLWENGVWSVADEHAATAITESALAALVTAAKPRPAAVPTQAPHVVVSCCEGEWHTLPGRMIAAVALVAGARVTFLGPSMPAEHLGRRLQAGDVDVLALSCTMPTNLIGAARCIAAAHDAGVPVVVGGRAFAGKEQRAVAIGADVFAPSAHRLAGPVPELAGRVVDIPAEALVLDATGDVVTALVFERMLARHPQLAGMTLWQQARTREDIQWMARYAGAAVLTHDATVLDDLLTWLHGLLAGEVPAALIATGARLLADVLEPDAPTGAGMLRDAAARLTDSADAVR
jgi:methanogenic corrinoid protein MtbC1